MSGINHISSKKSSSKTTGFTPRSCRSREANFQTRNDEFRLHYEVLCIFQKCNKIAAASFNVSSCAVKVLESCDNYRPDYVIINNLVSHVTPRILLYNKNAPREMIEQISRSLSNEDCKIQGLSSSLFSYANCKEILFSTQVLYTLDNGNYINSVINSADERLVCVLGALLNYLKENLPSLTSNNTYEPKINSISSITFENIVSIDNETYKSLQVYGTLQHPSGFKWYYQSCMDSSEGLSIYSIIEKNCCLLGSSKLRNFLASPTNDSNALKKRHEVIKFCNEPSNSKILQAMKTQISHLSPIEVLTGNVECANVRGKHWKCIYQNIYYSVLFAETCKENSNNVQLFQEVAMSITDEMYAMAYHMDRIIDFQSMEGNEIFVVKPGVSESLGKAKNKFSKLTSVINKVVPYEFDTVPSYINKIHILYIPEMKFLLSIPYWKKDLKKEELELPGLEYKFTSNKTAYYKTKRCYELDDILGDPQIEIMMEEANIIRSLGKYLRQNIGNTYSLIEKIAALDCLFALAALGKEHDYVEPVLDNEKRISIINGVHPLLKICTNEFIPNSITSSPEESLVKIIYGPNSSGKTVYLKQVALLVYLAHIGSFIPAKEANIGMCCQIHTCLSSSESIISESSSFLNDLRKLISLVNSSQPTSLLILDEIGKGTTELNGVAVLASCLNYFLSLGGRSPHVLVSTHLTDVSDYLQSSGSSFSVQVMNYAIEDGKLVFLYSIKGRNDIRQIDSVSNPIPEAPELITLSANKVLSALRSGENVTPYTTLRIQKCQRYYSFLQRFSTIDAKKEGIIRKLRRKVKSLMS